MQFGLHTFLYNSNNNCVQLFIKGSCDIICEVDWIPKDKAFVNLISKRGMFFLDIAQRTNGDFFFDTLQGFADWQLKAHAFVLLRQHIEIVVGEHSGVALQSYLDKSCVMA